MKHWYPSFSACLISLFGQAQAQTVPAALVVVSREVPGVSGNLSFQVLVVAQGAKSISPTTAEVAALSVTPNPATSSATLYFEHTQAGSVRVWVQDMLGSERAAVLRETKLGVEPVLHLGLNLRYGSDAELPE